MHTFEEVGEILDGIVDSLPSGILQGLNGGVYLVPEMKAHKRLPCPQYVVMGEYVRSSSLGNMIFIYYNSIMARYVDASDEEMRKVLDEVIRHEFRHHLEGRAGCRDLEVEDEQFVQEALRKQHKRAGRT